MKIYNYLFLICAFTLFACNADQQTIGNETLTETQLQKEVKSETPEIELTSISVLENAFNNRKSDIQVTQKGEVIAILPDDNDGSRHQKFIVKLGNGQTVLFAHNIDLSPRIENIAKNSMLTFCGEYEYNKNGGVIHWTHKDPRGNHTDGWILYNGKKYD